jgi:hypothetical protein
MSPPAAALFANSLSFVVCVIIATWYVVPWLRQRSRHAALAPLLWVHAFRHVALQVFSAQRAGLVVSDSLRDQIAYGDVAGMVLAVLALVALRAQVWFAIPLVWLFVIATLADLLNSLLGGMREGILASAHGVTWLILVFYVPVLWTTLTLVVWQLLTRRSEPFQEARGLEQRRASSLVWSGSPEMDSPGRRDRASAL